MAGFIAGSALQRHQPDRLEIGPTDNAIAVPALDEPSRHRAALDVLQAPLHLTGHVRVVAASEQVLAGFVVVAPFALLAILDDVVEVVLELFQVLRGVF